MHSVYSAHRCATNTRPHGTTAHHRHVRRFVNWVRWPRRFRGRQGPAGAAWRCVLLTYMEQGRAVVSDTVIMVQYVLGLAAGVGGDDSGA